MERQALREIRRDLLVAIVFALSLLLWAGPAAGQTDNGHWLPGEALPGIDSDIRNSIRWDPDGSGPSPELVVFGGGFTTAGGQPVSNIVAWDGHDWVTFSAGLPDFVSALAVFDNHLVASYSLYVGTEHTEHVALWDGAQWQNLGLEFDDRVEALAVYQGQLLAGGWFTRNSTTPIRGLARWDGSAWVEFAGGVAPQSPNHLTPVYAMFPFDGSLFIGGSFGYAGGVAASNIARWDGSAWHAVGGGVNGFVYDMTAHLGKLAVGGSFGTAGGVTARSIALWDGASWSSPGGGITATNSAGLAVASFNGELYVGGVFENYQPPLSKIAKWNGSAWVSPGGGTYGDVRSLIVSGGLLYAAGAFTAAGDTGSNGVSRWDGTSWSAIGEGLNDATYCVDRYQGRIIIGGRFSTAGDEPLANIAQRVDGHWKHMGQGIDGPILDLQTFRGDLIACGGFATADGEPANNIARWDGERWHPLGTGLDYDARVMTIYQGDLIVGGYISSAGGVPASKIARWDGKQWHAMGTGGGAFSQTPTALCVHQGKLYAAGDDTRPIVAEWTGGGWKILEGLAPANSYFEANALASFDGTLVVAGRFNRPSGIPGRDIARWYGEQWQSMASGATEGPGGISSLTSLEVVGDRLIVGGAFGAIDGVTANSIAQWDGKQWHPMAGGVRGGYPRVWQLHRIDHLLYAAGSFTIADDQVSAYLARWRADGQCFCDIAPDGPDGRVDEDDLLAVIDRFGPCADPDGCAADVNLDSIVNVADLLMVITNWGACP